jgi:hypothetical protein
MSRLRWMSWRTFFSLCAGVLLPLPLMLVLGRLLRPDIGPEVLSERRPSPMLSIDERSRLMTYGRPCESNGECEPPLGCLYASRYRHSYCTDSQCEVDAQCPEGQVCRPLATEGQEPLVRLCIPIGVRQEGENCAPVPADQQSACAAGLLCVGKDGWCARPCHLSAPMECPEGFFCADTRPQSACLPDCEKRGCPSGQHCLQFDEGSSQCAHVYGTHCQNSPCPEGQSCHVLPDPPHPGKAWLWCAERCGQDSPCPTGKVCDGWKCIPACDPQNAFPCSEGFQCQQPWPDVPFACRPDW